MARWTVRYGEQLRFAGGDLPAPTSRRVPTRHGKVQRRRLRTARRRPHRRSTCTSTAGHSSCDTPRWTTSAAASWSPRRASPSSTSTTSRHRGSAIPLPTSRRMTSWPGSRARRGVGPRSRPDLDRRVQRRRQPRRLSVPAGSRPRSTAAPRLQLLGVPSLDVAGDVRDKPSTIANPMIGPALLTLVRKTYFKDSARRAEPYASPLRAESVVGLPPAVIYTAEYDSLRAEGDAYAARLEAEGLLVEHRVVPRRDHYFLDADRPDQARELMEAMAAHVRTALA